MRTIQISIKDAKKAMEILNDIRNTNIEWEASNEFTTDFEDIEDILNEAGIEFEIL